MAGGALYVGYVGTKVQREEALKAGLSEYLFELENPRGRSAAEETYGRAIAEGSKLAEATGSEDGDDTLALLNCRVWPPGGDGIESRIVYIPFAAIDSWWIGSQKQVKRHAGGFFAGVVVPVDGE
jgi:hypothetical protein